MLKALVILETKNLSEFIRNILLMILVTCAHTLKSEGEIHSPGLLCCSECSWRSDGSGLTPSRSCSGACRLALRPVGADYVLTSKLFPRNL